jgi:hypothetical protein
MLNSEGLSAEAIEDDVEKLLRESEFAGILAVLVTMSPVRLDGSLAVHRVVSESGTNK